MVDEQLQRLAIIEALVRQKPGAGRTAVMKWLFLLTALKQVPLRYNFRLHTYGPFDGSVLGDVEYAEAIGVVESMTTQYLGGYGYSYKEGANAAWIADKTSEFSAAQRENVEWVLDRFGEWTAAELELASTLIYVDRRLPEDRTRSELVKKVHDVKRHRSREAIVSIANRMTEYLSTRP